MGFITSCFADFFVKSISMKHKFLSNSPATTFQKLFKTGAYKRVITPTHPSYSIAMATEFWQMTSFLAEFLIFLYFSWAALWYKHYLYLFDDFSTQHYLLLRKNVNAEVYKDSSI